MFDRLPRLIVIECGRFQTLSSVRNMGSPAELMLECRPSTTTTSTAFKSISYSNDQLERMRRLEDYLKALEDERKKIDAFKRELPFCMQLLHDAIEASKEELAECRPSMRRRPRIQVSCNFDKDLNLHSASDRSILEELVPLKKTRDTSSLKDNEEDHTDKKKISKRTNGNKPNWTMGAPLWNPQAEVNGHRQDRFPNTGRQSPQPVEEQAFSSSTKLFLHSKERSGGAFLPFSRNKQIVQPAPRPAAVSPPDLGLSCRDPEVSPTSVCENSGIFHTPTKEKSREDMERQVKGNGSLGDGSNVNQPARKARRCWSPELHRRFVNALQQLGGSHAATPKQIRELMKVDGLTNDEVKSHLQKYRLHTRRPSQASQTTAPHASHLVVLGGIWVPPEYAAHAAAAVQQAPALYGSANQPHSCQTSPREFHSPSPGPTLLHSSLHSDQNTGPAHSQSSPQGPLHFNGQSSAGLHASGDAGREESVGEDDKSENSSWKEQEPGQRFQVTDEDLRSLDGSVSGSQSQYSGEDEADVEDSRGRETRLKI